MSSVAVSEVDSKFFPTTFTYDDQYEDMRDVFNNTHDFMLNPSLTLPEQPTDFDIGADTEAMMDRYIQDYDLSDFFPQSDLHHSDSSDSGVNISGCMQIKQETQSNPSSPSSECGSEGYISGQDAFINAVVKTEDMTMVGAEDIAMMGRDPSLSTLSACMSDYRFFPQHHSADSSSSNSSFSLYHSPTSSSSSSSSSPVQGDQTLILIPKEEGERSLDLGSASELLLPSDLSQFPGSVLSPSSSSSTSSSPPSFSSPLLMSLKSESMPSSVAFSSVSAPLDYIIKQKVQILPKPSAVKAGAGGANRGRLPHVVSLPVVSGGAAIPVVAPKVGLKPVTMKPTAAKKLVLTPEEFTKLTASGALRFQPPSSSTSPNSITTATTPLLSATTSRGLRTATPMPTFTEMVSGDITHGLENTKSKRQQRMIKNRESASLSRKRKKEYLTTLEEKVREYTLENQKLKMENEVLKTKVQHLHDENMQLRQTTTVSPRKKALLLAIGLFLTFNINAFSSVLWWDNQQQHQHHTPVSVPRSAWLNDGTLSIQGRHLLSMADNYIEPDPPSSSSSLRNIGERRGQQGGNQSSEDDLVWQSEQARRMLQFDEDLQHLLTRGSLNESVVAAHFCPIYFNSTESSRLAEQLRGWMIREEEVKQKQHTPRVRSPGQRKKKAYPPVNILRAAMRGQYTRDLRDPVYRSEERRDPEEVEGGATEKFQVQVFQHSDPRQRLLSAIPRRNDTFYILSFNTDYFLVPATAHNTTARPRMSLAMPVVSQTLSDTMQPPEGSVGMMQIDCEILNTQLIHVQKSAFPQQKPQPPPPPQQHQHKQQHQQQQEQKQKQKQEYKEPPLFSSQYRNNTDHSAEPSHHNHNNETSEGGHS